MYDIDGDTIVVKISGHEETVRFIGADTPETHDPRKPVQCFGPTAAAHTKSLRDRQKRTSGRRPQDSDRDKYGRLLRYVYLPDGTLLNAELIRDGYAFAYTVFPSANWRISRPWKPKPATTTAASGPPATSTPASKSSKPPAANKACAKALA